MVVPAFYEFVLHISQFFTIGSKTELKLAAEWLHLMRNKRRHRRDRALADTKADQEIEDKEKAAHHPTMWHVNSALEID